MTIFASSESNLLADGNTIRTFDQRIRQIVPLIDRCFVLLESPAGVINNENIVCVSLNGAEVWRVQGVRWPQDDNPYLDMKLVDAELRASNWEGYECVIDVDTGMLGECVLLR